MICRNILKKFVIFCIVFVNLFLCGFSYAQSSDVIISILPFDNGSNNEEYSYLSSAMQNSVLSLLKNQDGIGIVSNDKSKKASEELGLNSETINNFSLVIRYGSQLNATVVLSGIYYIDEENEKINVEIYVFSIGQKKIIETLYYSGDLNVSIYDIMDNISASTAELVRSRKEDIQVAWENLKEDIGPPEYIWTPDVASFGTKNLKITWQTTQETMSTLYLSTKPNFSINQAELVFADTSENAINHEVIIGYVDLDPDEVYYFKTVDVNIIGDELRSEEKAFDVKDIIANISGRYIALYNKVLEKVNIYLKENNIEYAFKEALHLLEVTVEYQSILDLREYKNNIVELISEISTISDLRHLIARADQNIIDGFYEVARNSYKEALDVVVEYEFTAYISVEELETKLSRAENLVEIWEYIQLGNEMVSAQRYAPSVEEYKKALEKLKETKLQKYISEKKLDAVIKFLEFIIKADSFIHKENYVEVYNNIVNAGKQFNEEMREYISSVPEDFIDTNVAVLEGINKGDDFRRSHEFNKAKKELEKAFQIVESDQRKSLVSKNVVEYKLKQVDMTIECLEIQNDTDQVIIDRKFKQALDNYNQIMNNIIQYELEDTLDIDHMNMMIEKIRDLMDADELIKEGQRKFNAHNFADSLEDYQEALKIVRKNKADKYISEQKLKDKIAEILDILEKLPGISKLYLTVGSGAITNLLNDTFIVMPNAEVSINFRMNTKWALGLGINLSFLNLFGEFSFINNSFYIKQASSELLLRFGLKFDYFSMFMLEFGMGPELMLRYLVRWDWVGFYISTNFWTMFYFNPELAENSEFNILNLALNVGVVFNF